AGSPEANEIRTRSARRCLTGRERVEVRRPSVFAQEFPEDAKEHRLPVFASAVAEEELLLARVASKGVPDRAADKGDQIRIAEEDLLHELLPARAVRFGVVRDRHHVGEQRIAPVWLLKLAGSEIEDAVGEVEQPWIRV